jgi:hypothetical protein
LKQVFFEIIQALLLLIRQLYFKKSFFITFVQLGFKILLAVKTKIENLRAIFTTQILLFHSEAWLFWQRKGAKSQA